MKYKFKLNGTTDISLKDYEGHVSIAIYSKGGFMFTGIKYMKDGHYIKYPMNELGYPYFMLPNEIRDDLLSFIEDNLESIQSNINIKHESYAK